MLVTSRVYQLSQVRDKGAQHEYHPQSQSLRGWTHSAADYRNAAEMLLVHQTGSVKVGEVVRFGHKIHRRKGDLTNESRYTLSYTPSADRILPAPAALHVKIRNTTAIPLRAAYLHGPYTIYAACYPDTYNPDKKHDPASGEGVPSFEPNLKAAGHWSTTLTIPEEIRNAVGGPKSRQSLEGRPRKCTWIIEIASQVLFSTTASVSFEVLVGRDERSVELGFSGIASTAHAAAGALEDHQISSRHNQGQAKGVYSKAIHLVVEDTESLWNSPEFPSWDDDKPQIPPQANEGHSKPDGRSRRRKRKKVHLVVLTHGIHSNIGADMLYMKESIDASAKTAREDAKRERARKRAENRREMASTMSGRGTQSVPELSIAPTSNDDVEDDDEDEENVIVRGFSGNAVKTERGIQYMGKRLAKYVLSITYPDQPFLPVKSSISKSITRSLTGQKNTDPGKKPSHKGSSIHRDDEHSHGDLPYQITSISFIAHSLGGCVQTYAIAYIQKHSPDFFRLIRPINFVALASPFLGLSNENPIYVKFALDFGLVGRTGQDLGLTWRPPYMVRSGWSAMIGGRGKEAQKSGQPDPAAKPLLRILPTGPAHSALKKFRNRTVYSNVVNDGIVPLRTSCLLFLDWRGLERVEKARRESGLVGTMAGWGWAELTGQNASSPRQTRFWNDLFGDNDDSDSNATEAEKKRRDNVPQPDQSATTDDNIQNSMREPKSHQFIDSQQNGETTDQNNGTTTTPKQNSISAWSEFLSIFKTSDQKSRSHPLKHAKIYQRGQTMGVDASDNNLPAASDTIGPSESTTKRMRPVRGSSLYAEQPGNDGVQAPPKTSFFESASDLLDPPLPTKEFLLDPAARPRTIFHDRVYHPEDIPAPPVKKQRSSLGQRSISFESFSRSSNSSPARPPSGQPRRDTVIGSMKVEEKIARAYHYELSWRKVLVRLEPDAHNNIVVRRMFANAYGWPVIKHLCDTHFAYTAAARTEDKFESNEERANASEAVGPEGEQVKGQSSPPKSTSAKPPRRKSADGQPSVESQEIESAPIHRTESEHRESRDEVSELKSPLTSSYSSSVRAASGLARSDSARWSDRFFDVSDDDSDADSEQQSFDKSQRSGESSEIAQAAPTVIDVLSSSPKKEKDLKMPRLNDDQPVSESENTPHPGGPDGILTDAGIGMRPEQRISTSIGDAAEPHLAIAEQVAFAQRAKKKGDQSRSNDLLIDAGSL